MLKVEIRGLDEVRAALTGFSDRRFAAAIATALTRTAVQARDAVYTEMVSKLDRPTPYTLRSLFVSGARADRLQAMTFFKDNTGGYDTPATKYLLPQVEGGAGRSIKRFERALIAKGSMPSGWHAVPAKGARLDAFGNVSRGQIMQIISQLGTELLAGSDRSMSTRDKRSAINAQKRAGGRFYAVLPGQGKQPGIYQREFTGRNVTPVFIFVQSTTYKKRFDFYGVAGRVVQDNLSRNVQQAIGEHERRLAARGK